MLDDEGNSSLELSLSFQSKYCEVEPNAHKIIKCAKEFELPEFYRVEIRYLDEVINRGLENINKFFRY